MMKKKRLHILFAIFLFALSCSVKKEAPVKNRPNFLIIMADDLGYTDLGCYGGEIRTPNLDALARNGILNTDFYTSPTCSPTRAMLLSGVDAHRSGFGTMEGDWAENQRGLRGYEGYLNFDIVPFPQLLQAEGYHTSIAGKWHQASPPVRKDLWPVNRGFSKSFCLAQGGAGHFSDKQKLLPMIKSTLYFSDSSLVDTLPHDFYSSKNYVDKSIEFIGQSLAEQKPFFHFLAFTAPHWPLQVPDESADLYKGKYDAGYEALTKSRFERGKALGIIPQNAQLPPLLPNVKPWESLSPAEKQSAARTMEIYAAMIDVMDVQIGRLLHFLKEKGVLDNTVILFSGDNGAEGNSIMGYEGTGEWVDTTFDNSLQNMGRVGSYVQLGSAWAQAAATPFHWYKAFSYEGGVRAPSIFHFPKHTLQNGKTNRQWLTILDIAPTVLEMAGVKHPDTVFQGKKIFLLDGKSMLPWLSGREGSAHPEHEPYVWELFGRIGVRCGDWKAVKVEKPYGTGDWELYNLRDDIGELHDLSGKNSEKTKEMAAYWDIYEKKYNVTLPNRPTAYAKENYWKK